jgi:tetratricopeptide (TPR) repeat protein
VAAASDSGGADALALAELEQQLGDLSDAAERLTGLDGPAAEQLRGRIALETGRPADAVTHLLRAEQLGASGAGVTWPLTMALCEVARFGEAADRAIRQLAAAGDDRPTRLDALANLAVIDARQGQFAESAARLEEARALAAELGDAMRLATVTGDLAGTRYAMDRTREAAELLAEAAAIAERLGSRRMVAMTLGNAAAIRLEAADHEGARQAAAASAAASLQIGDAALALNALQVPVLVAEIQGALAEAGAWWRRHALLEEQLGRPSYGAMSWFRHASALAGLGLVPDARTVLDRTEVSAALLDDEDVRFERDRARAAVDGRYTSPVDADQPRLDLPPLDASLPRVAPADVEGLFDDVERLLTERGSLSA